MHSLHMKTFFLLTTALGLATATLYAQVDSTAPPPAPNATEAAPAPSVSPEPAQPLPTETPVKAKHEPPRALDQKGKIEKIDVEAGTFVVGGKTFVLSKKGRVFVDGVKVPLSNIKEGDLVAVVYFAKADGTNTATRIIKGRKEKKKVKGTEPSRE